jgi:putative hydrolase of the HAD superfamily
MISSKYKHIFFDLDHTLWDFEKNSAETLTELYNKFNLQNIGIDSLELFIKFYQNRNEVMWEQYRYGKIDRDTLRNKRFEFTFDDLGIDEPTLSKSLSEEYIRIAPYKTNLFPDTHEVLTYLKEKYVLHIITNGFVETQFKKMNSSQLTSYFSEIIISEQTGFKKPDPNIFIHAIERANTNADESLMIGDNLDVDIAGARSANIDQVYFNPNKLTHQQQSTYEISSLIELKEFL